MREKWREEERRGEKRRQAHTFRQGPPVEI
jgi:hypothetical protein